MVAIIILLIIFLLKFRTEAKKLLEALVDFIVNLLKE